MPLVPVNNPPAPVQEQAGVAVPAQDPCAKIDEDFDFDVDTYKNHEKRKSEHNQSHHILQDDVMENLVDQADGMSVLLVDRYRGTEHQSITKRQNKRMNNKKHGKAGETPATTFGDLKKQAKEDLVEGLKGKKPTKDGSRTMTEEEAKIAADCLVARAEQQAKEKAEAKGKTLDDSTGPPDLKVPPGCLAPGTPVWLASGAVVAVESLQPGDCLLTDAGPEVVVRIDACHHDLVEIDFGDEVLTIASAHRVLLANGGRRRADGLGAGDQVSTIGGPRVVADLRVLAPRRALVYRIGCHRRVVCAIGQAGMWTVMPAGGPRVSRRESVVPFVSEEAQACLS